jgi:hypothetical protein
LRHCDVLVIALFGDQWSADTATVRDRSEASLSHTLDWGVLLLVVGALLTGAMLLEASSTVVRRQMEDQSWAEGRCAHSNHRETCISGELAKSNLEAVRSQLLLAFMAAVLVAAGVIVLRRELQRRSGHAMESSVDGSG